MVICYESQHGRRPNYWYEFEFDSNYCQNKPNVSNHSKIVNLDRKSAQDFERNFSLLKAEMDSWFEVHPKNEREYQHKLLLQNSFIVDIEYQIKNHMRLDMLAVSDGCLFVIENKYGVKAMSGKSGMADHYDDCCVLFDDKKLMDELFSSVDRITECKKELGLLKDSIPTPDRENFKLLFLLADFKENGREKLNKEIEKIKNKKNEKYEDKVEIIIPKSKDQFEIDFKSARKLSDFRP